ncbi:hypothetical protein RRG08_042956 [Elysia crispata]|uniref:Uncharacterized protein n=1 Tax=Elysia crispata TaxID=231223 RepID=A0AAE1E6P3_9GAST|nr:hypothetical protein RRG08_042956 [Elysia crispata]
MRKKNLRQPKQSGSTVVRARMGFEYALIFSSPAKASRTQIKITVLCTCNTLGDCPSPTELHARTKRDVLIVKYYTRVHVLPTVRGTSAAHLVHFGAENRKERSGRQSSGHPVLAPSQAVCVVKPRARSTGVWRVPDRRGNHHRSRPVSPGGTWPFTRYSGIPLLMITSRFCHTSTPLVA